MSWQISGQYMETCNCTLLCPCIYTNLAGRPTEGECKVALAMRVDKGAKDGVALDGVKFMVVMYSPGPMGDGNLTVGLIIDSAASPAQAEAIGAIATGQAGGPLAALGPLIGKVAGLERQPITFEMNGMTRSSRAGDLVEQVCEGLPGGNADEPMSLDNTPHPIASRLALAKAIRSKFQAFGIRWDDSTGTRNGHFAPFAWSG
ncbi:DUF1326 domain-containing protein [Ideonella sp. YS5]|uniref:DUF1326 domain-containing protein n=1 Tax=Ideonella sp. YS5 TaxID=3453714 RepID=UPI003EECF702